MQKLCWWEVDVPIDHLGAHKYFGTLSSKVNFLYPWGSFTYVKRPFFQPLVINFMNKCSHQLYLSSKISYNHSS